MPAPLRTRLGVDERRAQLLERGRQLFNSRPYDEISIDDIAEAAGISKGLLYHYFDSKRRFYVETVRDSVAQMNAATEPDPTLPPLERLEASLDAYIDYVQRSGSAYTSLMTSGAGADAELAEIFEGQRQVVVSRVLSGLGIGDPPPPLLVAVRGWVGFLEAVSIAWSQVPGGVERETVRELFVNALRASLETCADRYDDLAWIRQLDSKREVSP